MKATLVLVSLALFVAVYGAEFSDEQKEKIRKNHKECLEETGVDQAKVDKVRKGDFSNDDEDLQRYIFCMFQKAGIMTDDGTFLKDVAMTKLPPDADRQKVSDAIDACIDTKGNTPHHTAFLMTKCYHEKNPDHAIM